MFPLGRLFQFEGIFYTIHAGEISLFMKLSSFASLEHTVMALCMNGSISVFSLIFCVLVQEPGPVSDLQSSHFNNNQC